MNFTPVPKNIQTIFSIKKKYIIPRFQRTYSWDRAQINEFLLDLIVNLKINDDKIETSPYFFGTILLIGDYEDTTKNLEIIDGQQRLTTFTILFSVISKIFKENGEDTLSDELFKLIMGRDINGEEIALLVNETSQNYFARLVQTKDENNEIPVTDEEVKIKFAFDYLYNSLQESRLRKLFEKYNEDLKDLDYIELISSIRNQLLQCMIITITTKNHSIGNMIFETLNAKGSKLKSIDLIKNKVFEVIKTEEPIDEAKILWKDMISNLSIENIRTDIGVFVRHYWNSKYNTSGESQLYNDFSKTIKKKENIYIEFLKDLRRESVVYRNIIKPDFNYYQNNQNYYEIHFRLENISNVMNIIQVRPFILALDYRHKIRDISTKQYRFILELIENFHFAFNILASERPSKLNTIYMKKAIELRSVDKTHINNIVNDFKNELKKLLPKEQIFTDEFIKLTYSKEHSFNNVYSKYAVRNIEFILSGSINIDIYKSIEHIVNEDINIKETINIGNLVYLEENINNAISVNDYESKRQFYMSSNNKSINFLLENYEKFDSSDINNRAISLAKLYYKYIQDLFQ